MTNKEVFEQIIKDCKDHKIVKPLDSYVDYDTTIGEYYEEEIEDLKKDLEVLEILKVVCKHIFIGVDIVNKEDCFGTIIVDINNVNYQIYVTHDYEEVIKLKKVKEWLENE